MTHMTYVPITPFRGTVTPTLLAEEQRARGQASLPRADKWEVLRELGVAAPRLGLTDRQLTVLQALLSFYPETDLSAESASCIVFPSNASICERLNGMPCSTMRRHLSGLVTAGLLVRRDSPNGKRYASRRGDAFGFDLSPLAYRFAEICNLAEAVRADRQRLKRLRQSVSLMRRDLASLALYGAETRPDLTLWDRFGDLAMLTARDLRRRLSPDDLEAMSAALQTALDQVREILEAENPSITGTPSEHHILNTNTDQSDLEPCQERAASGDGRDHAPTVSPAPDDTTRPNLPLSLVTSVCLEITTYAGAPVRHWHDLVRAAEVVHPMMGITPSAWADACEAMGPAEASVVVAAMLERLDEIQSPGGYLRHLARRAAAGQFSCGPMVMALMRREAA